MTEPPAAEQAAYDELYAWAMTRGGLEFILQHVVDAFAAQWASPDGKPIELTFALVGLYLHLERGFNGKAVQGAHMTLARRRTAWPAFSLPTDRGALTAIDVLATSPDADRARAIDAWCRAVWDAYGDARPTVVALLAARGIL